MVVGWRIGWWKSGRRMPRDGIYMDGINSRRLGKQISLGADKPYRRDEAANAADFVLNLAEPARQRRWSGM
jgi:hypothetical protein